MSTKTEKIRITDNAGFYYEVILEHKPHFGFSTAIFNGNIIGQVQLGRILSPISDDDYEWECYEERFAEWKDEIVSNIIPICKDYFNKQ